MDLETILLTRIKELNESLNELKHELEKKHQDYQSTPQTKNFQKEILKIYEEIGKLQFIITSTKGTLDTIINQFALVNSLNEKKEFTDEEEKKLSELSHMNLSDSDEPVYKKDFTGEEADAIREAFEKPLGLYSNMKIEQEDTEIYGR